MKEEKQHYTTRDALFDILRCYAGIYSKEGLHDFPFSDIEEKIIELIILIVKELE